MDRQLAPKKALTHMHVPLDYATVMAETPDFVDPTYDGMVSNSRSMTGIAGNHGQHRTCRASRARGRTDHRDQAHRRLDTHSRGSRRQCGCAVGQIVKSLVFHGEQTGRLYLFLVSGANQLDPTKAAALTAEPLARADPRRIRDETGFAIGGVAPIGHRITIATFADQALLGYDRVWAAAGAHDAVFAAEPSALFRAADAKAADLARC